MNKNKLLGQKYLLDYIEKLPNRNTIDEKVKACFKKIKKKLQPEIDEYKARLSAASARYQETKNQDDWDVFCTLRGIYAGKISGLKKTLYHNEKIIFIECILNENKIKHPDYSLIQFIAKFLDGKEIDKTICLELRNGYKGHKVAYEIPEDKKEFWETVKLSWELKGDYSDLDKPIKKVVKI